MRHLMEPDPDAKGPSLTTALWLYAAILAIVILIGVAAGSH